ncbi:DUF5302 domain-containing protein, partial [Streptomyces pilosus]
MTAEPTPAEGSEPASSETSPLTPDTDGNYDLKRKFREALARKRGAQAEAADAAAHPHASPVRAAPGPAGPQRSY